MRMENPAANVIAELAATNPAGRHTAGKASIPAPIAVPATRVAAPSTLPGSWRRSGPRFEKRRNLGRREGGTAAVAGVVVVVGALVSLFSGWLVARRDRGSLRRFVDVLYRLHCVCSRLRMLLGEETFHM